MGKIINLNPSEDDEMIICNKLIDYNSKFWETEEERKFTILEVDEREEMIGGISCSMFGNWLEVHLLWVDEEYRSNGIGKSLLNQAEKITIENNCTKASLDTMNFQAKPFYLKNGYKTVYVQKGYPITNVRYFLEKVLV